jgi:flavodoxin
MTHDARPAATRTGLTRRTVLQHVGTLSLAATAGCSPPTSSTPSTEQPQTASAPAPGADRNPRALLAYFSRAGENYHYGGRRNLEVGHTEVVAGLIADRLDTDTYRVEAAESYPFSYDDTVERNRREQAQDARPALATPPPPLEGYDVVLLGSPVWNVGAPMIMHTLLDQCDLRGKTILPFVTYTVSGMGRVAEEYATLAPDATIGKGLAVQGEEAAQATDEVSTWLRRVGPMLQSSR